MRIALAGLVVATVAAGAVSAAPSSRKGSSSQGTSDPLRGSGSSGGAGSADQDRSAQARSKGLSLEQIRGVMRANAEAFNACLTAATKHGAQLHGPFLYEIEVDKKGKVTSAHPYQPSSVAAFDKCIVGVLKRAKFPGGPANVETPLVFDPS